MMFKIRLHLLISTFVFNTDEAVGVVDEIFIEDWVDADNIFCMAIFSMSMMSW